MQLSTHTGIRRLLLGSCSLLGLLLAGQAVALPLITFTLLEARWENNVGGSNVTYDPPAPGFGDPATVTWGDGDVPDSGYEFDARDTPFSEAPNTLFELGDFTHNNFPIPAGTSITSIDLRLRGDLDVTNSDGTPQTFSNVQFLFNFGHWETPNGANPCANGEANGQGVNSGGCADRVTITGLPGDSEFEVDGQFFTLDIDGFELSGSPVSEFWTAEGQANTATLLASYRSTSPPSQIPEPGSLVLIGIALVGLGFARKRAKAA